MSRRGTQAASILTALGLLGVLVCTSGCVALPLMNQDPACREAPYWNPSGDLEDAELVGTWATRYDGPSDRLIISADGTFKQVYEERIGGVLRVYFYETSLNPWWVERFPDGRIRVHFEGARYYPSGSGIAELDGMAYGQSSRPWPFRDPFAGEYVEMVGELVLNVRVDSHGELLLHHMFYSADEGFATAHCQQQYFRRIEAP